jgi:hypothetical protein
MEMTQTEQKAFIESLSTAFAEKMATLMPQQQQPTTPLQPWQTRQKATVGNTGTFNLIHGHGSLFGQVAVGIEPEVISTMMHWEGLGDVLPKFASKYTEVFLPFITGVEPTSSDEQSTECGNCISGETEACIQHMPTARVCRQTQDMTITRIVDRLNRGDIDLELLNRQLGAGSAWHPGTEMVQENIMQIYTAWALLFELPPLFMHALSPMVYNGNPANNIGQAYREFRGLDLLINTGHVDAFTNTACEGLDSDIKDANYDDVTTAQNPSVYERLEWAHWYLLNNARKQRLSPVTHAITMRADLWGILSQLIPVQRVQAALMNYVANMPERFRIQFNGSEVVNERDMLRQQRVIPLNGMMVPVVIDDGINELNNANDANLDPGEYASDIYIVPATYLQNRDATKIEYKDYRSIAAEIAGTGGMIDGLYRATPDGRFAWALLDNGPCFAIQAYTEPRIILRTPQLAGRIQNVKYVPQQHLRDPDPDSAYFFKGGVSTRAPASYYF